MVHVTISWIACLHKIKSFEEALINAQKLGYAESDSTFDIGGSMQPIKSLYCV